MTTTAAGAPLGPSRVVAAQQVLDSLWLQIQNNRIDAVENGGVFVPPASLTAIFTPTAIAAAVAELPCAPEDRLGLANAIRRGGVRTFAVLVWMRQPQLAVAFRRKRCLDRLPLDDETARLAAGDYAPTFLRLQWEFAPFHFRREPEVVDIGREILPFVSDLGTLAPGGFSDVQKLEVHPSLQDFAPLDSEQVVIVRKRLRRDAFASEEARLASLDNETRCLRLVNHPPHPNIVPLLTSYTYNSDCFMLFPHLDMDLRAFLSRERPYGKFRQRFTYFSALHGLASAVARVHNVRIRADGVAFDGIGYHHDVRPANVLVSRDTFLLADLGLGRVRAPEDGSTTRFKALAGDYAAPECADDDFVPGDVGRAADVWALACLASEVLTYAYLGVGGLEQFRAARMATRPSGVVTDSMFHDGSGRVKAAVEEWIAFLARQERRPLGAPLQHLVLSVFTPAEARPNISRLCLALGHLSLGAHFFAVFDALAGVVDDGGAAVPRASLMKLWFERERLRAFGIVVSLFSTAATDDDATEFARRHGDKCVKSLLELFDQLPGAVESSVAGDAAAQGSPSSDERLPTPMPQSHGPASPRPHQSEEVRYEGASPPAAAVAGEGQQSLEADVQRLVEELWGVLSEDKSRTAERIWMHSMLDATDSIDQLGRIERSLGTQAPVAYQQGAALTAMKKIRLEILGSPRRDELVGLEIRDPVPKPDAKLTHGHQMGDYKDGARVLIESVHYDSSWDAIPSEEQTLTMALKASGFNPKPRPSSLRLLDCLGFFETGKDGGPKGFSFVYQVPEPSSGPDPAKPAAPGMITLNKLLDISRQQALSARQTKADVSINRPLLEDKFRLAGMLAGFLAEFHSIGWLHESFHSNNMVFFHTPPDLDEKGISPATSSVLRTPFVVGLNKSRPGGEAWHTRGPALDSEFLDYRHPAYARTRRFRVGYDYFSLGLVLLEIGLWTPLAVVSAHRKNRALSPKQLRGALLADWVPRLGCKMGGKYRDAVHALLSDRLDPEPEREVPDAAGESRAFGAFLDVVVAPLEQLASSVAQ